MASFPCTIYRIMYSISTKHNKKNAQKPTTHSTENVTWDQRAISLFVIDPDVIEVVLYLCGTYPDLLIVTEYFVL